MAVVLRCLGAFIQSMASCAMYEAGRASAGVSECPPHALVTRVGEVVGEGGVEKRGGVGGCCLFPSISGMVTMLRALLAPLPVGLKAPTNPNPPEVRHQADLTGHQGCRCQQGPSYEPSTEHARFKPHA